MSDVSVFVNSGENPYMAVTIEVKELKSSKRDNKGLGGQLQVMIDLGGLSQKVIKQLSEIFPPKGSEEISKLHLILINVLLDDNSPKKGGARVYLATYSRDGVHPDIDPP